MLIPAKYPIFLAVFPSVTRFLGIKEANNILDLLIRPL